MLRLLCVSHGSVIMTKFCPIKLIEKSLKYIFFYFKVFSSLEVECKHLQTSSSSTERTFLSIGLCCCDFEGLHSSFSFPFLPRTFAWFPPWHRRRRWEPGEAQLPNRDVFILDWFNFSHNPAIEHWSPGIEHTNTL